MAIGIGLGIHRRKGGGWTPTTDEYKALLAVLNTAPDLSIQEAQDTFIASGKTHGWWQKMVCIIPYGAGMPVAADSLFWWNDVSRKATLSATAPTYAVGQGWTGGTTAKYIDTTFNPSTDGGTKFTLDDASHCIYIYNRRLATNSSGMGTVDASPYRGVYFSPLSAGSAYARINGLNTTGTNIGGEETKDLWVINRKTNAAFELWKRKVKKATPSNSSVLLINGTVYDLATRILPSTINDALPDTVGFRSFGSSLTDAEIGYMVDDVEALFNSVNSFTRDYTWTEPAWQGSGIVLAFDDIARLASWVAVNQSLKASYDWKMTAFINAANEATLAASYSNIRTLQDDGHEIANHSVNHIDWQTYLLTHTDAEFYNTEIAPLQTWFQNNFGFKPVTYGYAQVAGNDTSLNAEILSHPEFKRVRPATASFGADIKDYFIYPTDNNPAPIFINSWAFSGVLADILTAIDLANSEGAIIPLYFHTIGGASDSELITTLATIQAICAKVVANGMKFYRMKDIPA